MTLQTTISNNHAEALAELERYFALERARANSHRFCTSSFDLPRNSGDEPTDPATTPAATRAAKPDVPNG